MEEVYGDEMFDVLECPPLEDFAFNFVSDDGMNLTADFFLDDQVVEDVSDRVPIRLKRQQPPRKGKELKRVIQVLKPTRDQLKWIGECLKQEADDDHDDAVVNKKNNNQPNKINAEPNREYFCDKKALDESSIQLKFESAKKNLRDSYRGHQEKRRFN